MYCLKLKVASRKLWESPPPKIFPSSLLSVARSLFNQVFPFQSGTVYPVNSGVFIVSIIVVLTLGEFQIIYAHKKSFDAGKFAEIKSVLCAFGKSVVTVCVLPLIYIAFLHLGRKINSIVPLGHCYLYLFLCFQFEYYTVESILIIIFVE